jgi:chromosome segregation ATPase
MSKISEKQKLLNQLEKQLAELHKEINTLQELNPQYKEMLDRLSMEREELLKTLNKQENITLFSFIEMDYKWQGVDLYPKILSYRFLVDDKVGNFLEKTIVDYHNLEQIFDINDEKIPKILKHFELMDKKVVAFNKKVKKALKELEEDQFGDLLI